MFQYISYSETPQFPHRKQDKLFNYPFIVSKRLIRTFMLQTDATSFYTNFFYMKKTYVCLEAPLIESLKLQNYIIKAFHIILEILNPTDHDGHDHFTLSCSDPFEKWSLGRQDAQEGSIKPSSNVLKPVNVAVFVNKLHPKIDTHERKT